MQSSLFNVLLAIIIFSTTNESCRPNPAHRSFTSVFIDNLMNNITSILKDPTISTIFNCTYPNTLDTTVNFTDDSDYSQLDTFIITGDINAMWLRDSTWQVNGYIKYANNDTNLFKMLFGLHNRHMNSILITPYANAFNPYNNNAGHQKDKTHPPMNGYVFENKYELDSLCSVLHFTWYLFNITKDVRLINSAKWMDVVNKIYDVLKYQQNPTSNISSKDELYYSFQRETTAPTDTLIHSIGPPALFTGMVKTAFRPSDDATRLPFNVASNAFAIVVLRRNALLFRDELNNTAMYDKLNDLSNEIENGIETYGIINDGEEDYYAYEVDGYGSHFFMDDGNVPSLMALPYLGYLNMNDSIYVNTRGRLLNIVKNPYYFEGLYNGIGSPHTGANNIWPMAIILQAITSSDDDEIKGCLNELQSTTAGTYFMHESFNKNNPKQYTRSWFAWCNNLFGQLILQLIQQRPWLVI